MSDLDSLLIFGGFLVGVLGAVAIASARDPNIRRKITVVTKTGLLDSFWVNRKNLVRENGAWFYKYRGNRYVAAGPQYQFTYRLVRSFGMRKYIGFQRIYLEGNPSPYAFDEDKKMALLRDTARILSNAADTDLPTRLLRPRKMDLLVILLVALMTFFVGFAIGGRV